MCIAVPAEIVEIIPGPMPVAKVSHGGKLIECSLMYFPAAQVGEYALVQHGIAVELLAADEAQLTLEALKEVVEIPT
ncbi:MAG: HypC/HybG/HupF family hydrogenase formation chaperone [Propionibacteriaceae bacterium]|jgi:hydrogenase expression/formation protein HypC|nr:HypC/HybG/HupF family hydrogenase formation chaperone [Propionibacteriaceae bacterium]